MKARSVPPLALACAIFTAAAAGAPAPAAASPAREWTEEQILAAEPLPLPADSTELGTRRVADGGEPTRSARAGSRPSPPRLRAGTSRARYVASPARLRARWTGAGSGVVTARNRGTAGFNFSSSRLVPDDAGTSYPYSTVGVLFFRVPGRGAFRCSAAVVAKRVIATAGHCVYSSAGGFATDFLFVPGFHEGLAPFGAWDGVEAYVTEEWQASPEVPSVADFGVVVLADADGVSVGELTGWLGFKTGNLANNHIKMVGYPGNHDGGRQMHQIDTGDWILLEDPPAVIYGSDMRGGSSGGPWVQNFGVKAKGQRGGKNKAPNRIVGITSAGFEDKRLLMQESSILGSSFKRIFDEACAQAAGNCGR